MQTSYAHRDHYPLYHRSYQSFIDASHLVGYAMLGTRVHDSGQVHQNGRITKCGRRDLRGEMVKAANAAVRHHPFWKHEFERLEPRLGRSKTIMVIARKLLVRCGKFCKKR
jgi:transposase